MALAAVVAAVAIVVVSVLFMFGGSGETSPDRTDPYALEKSYIFSQGGVVIIQGVDGDDTMKELASNVRIQETFDSVKDFDVVIIDSEYAKSFDREYLCGKVDSLILESHPVMLRGADSPWVFTDREVPFISIGFSLDREDLFCLFYDANTGASYSNSITGCDMQESTEVAYEWAKELMDLYGSN
ncbi:MAG: hypothetical protein LBU30_02875 [Candidatus Methanoplasma sp.]|nr:hypothetical protein [Candidatus Methanoplasma sp.]